MNKKSDEFQKLDVELIKKVAYTDTTWYINIYILNWIFQE